MKIEAGRVFLIGDSAEFYPHAHLLRVGDRVVRLRPHAGAVLTHMLMNPDRLISKSELLEAVWPGVVVTDNSLVQCVTEIRRELGADRVAIETIARRGYWLHSTLGDVVGVPGFAPKTDLAQSTVPSLPLRAGQQLTGHWRGMVAVLGMLLLLG